MADGDASGGELERLREENAELRRRVRRLQAHDVSLAVARRQMEFLLEHTRPAQDALTADVRTDIATTTVSPDTRTERPEVAAAMRRAVAGS